MQKSYRQRVAKKRLRSVCLIPSLTWNTGFCMRSSICRCAIYDGSCCRLWKPDCKAASKGGSPHVARSIAQGCLFRRRNILTTVWWTPWNNSRQNLSIWLLPFRKTSLSAYSRFVAYCFSAITQMEEIYLFSLAHGQSPYKVSDQRV